MSSRPEKQPEIPEQSDLTVEGAVDAAIETPQLELVGGATSMSLEISAEEIENALQNPVEQGTHDLEAEAEPNPTPEELEQMTAALHERFPDIQSQIDAFNSADDSPLVDLDKLEANATTVVDQTTQPGVPATTSELDDLVSQVRGEDDSAATPLEIPDDGQMSDADIAALFDQVQSSDPVTPDPVHSAAEGGPMSPDEIAAMFAQADQVPTTGQSDEEASDGPMSPDEIAAMLAQAESEPAIGQTAAGSDDGPMSPDEIAAMFAQAEPLAEETADDAPMSLEDIQKLVLESESMAPSAPDSSMEAPADGDLRILGMDDLKDMLENGAKLTAPTADFKPAEPEPVPGIPMVDEDAQFDPPADLVSLVEEPEAPVITESAEWDPEVVARVPMALAVAALALPLRFEDEKLVCLVADPIDHGAIGQLSQALHCMVDTRPAPISDVVRSLRAAYAEADATSARLTMDTVAGARPSMVDLVKTLWKKVA